MAQSSLCTASESEAIQSSVRRCSKKQNSFWNKLKVHLSGVLNNALRNGDSSDPEIKKGTLLENFGVVGLCHNPNENELPFAKEENQRICGDAFYCEIKIFEKLGNLKIEVHKVAGGSNWLTINVTPEDILSVAEFPPFSDAVARQKTIIFNANIQDHNETHVKNQRKLNLLVVFSFAETEVAKMWMHRINYPLKDSYARLRSLRSGEKFNVSDCKRDADKNPIMYIGLKDGTFVRATRLMMEKIWRDLDDGNKDTSDETSSFSASSEV